MLMSHMVVVKNPQKNVHEIYFRPFLIKFIFNIKIDIIMYEPHRIKLFFL